MNWSQLFGVWLRAGWMGALIVSAGCSGGGGADGGGGGGIGGAGGASTTPNARYAASTLVFGPSGTTTFVTVLEDLESGLEINLDDAREISGSADAWVYDGKLFVASSEDLTVERFNVTADGSWESEGRISFASYGLTSVAFWNNVFINREKAYMANGSFEYVVWNPAEMTVVESVALPELAAPPGTRTRLSFADRAAVLRDGLLYHVVHWSSQDLSVYAPDSAIVVFDPEADALVDVIDAPCPGLDVATQDDAGNLYFSNWVFSVGTHLLADGAANCVVKIPAGSDTLDDEWTTDWSDLSGGNEGGALRWVSGPIGAVTVFHDEDVTIDGTQDPEGYIASENWSLDFLNLEDRTMTTIEGIERNSGAFYTARIGDRTFALVPAADYATTTVYELTPGEPAARAYEINGWSLRLFELP
ncbi:MAG: hypothetical protein AAF997_17210 [Myxococcota bacterium]